MSYGDGQVDFKLELELIDVGTGTGIWDTSVWDTGTWSGEEPNWTDVTSYALAASTRNGKDRFLIGDFETGTATFRLNNDTGAWTPVSGQPSPGSLTIRPGVWVRLSARYVEAASAVGTIADTTTTTGWIDGRTWTNHGSNELVADAVEWVPLWTGRVMDVVDVYDPGAAGVTSTVTAVGFLADLAQLNPPDVSATGTELTSARISYILDEAGWLTSYRDIDTGIYTSETSTLPNNYLEEARIAARAEGGAFFNDGRGYMMFRQANWLLEDLRSTTVQAYVGDSRIGIADATPVWSLSRVYNQVIYSNTASDQQEDDTTSQGKYGIRTLRKTVLNNDNTDTDSLATRDLAILASDELVVESITIEPLTRFQSIFCIDTKIGDLIEVTVTTLQGWEYTQQLHVAGIEHTVTADDWSATFRLDKRTNDSLVS